MPIVALVAFDETLDARWIEDPAGGGFQIGE